jgi:hypothetical protein
MLTYPELRNFISLSRADDTCEMFDCAVAVFDKYSVPGYMDLYDTTLGQDPHADSEEVIRNLIDDTLTLATHLLTMQGVQVNDAAPVKTVLELVDATFDMVYYEDRDYLGRILSLDGNPVEVYGTLVNLVSHLTVEDVLMSVVNVTPGFITTFKEQLMDNQNPVDSDEQLPKIINAYRVWKEQCRNGDVQYADRYLQQNATIGLPFQTYVHLYQKDDRYLSDHNEDNLDMVAGDLVGLALISEDGYGNPLTAIRSQLSMLYPDIGHSTHVDLAINKYLTEYSRK